MNSEFFHQKCVYRVMLVCLVISVVSSLSERYRRAVFPQFPAMILQVVGRNPLAYNEYGNYCGFGSNEEEPVDDTDRCCKIHDECYGEAQDKHCGTIIAKPAPYLVPYGYGLDFQYKYTVEESSIKCENTTTGFTGQVVGFLSTTLAKCAYTVCQCDADAVLCFNQSIYNPEYKRGVVPTAIKYTGVAISAPFHIATAVAKNKISIAKSLLRLPSRKISMAKSFFRLPSGGSNNVLSHTSSIS